MADDDVRTRLETWLRTQLPDADEVAVEDLDRSDVGHSAETLTLTVRRTEGGVEHRDEVVLRLRPPEPGLLEPYDLRRQFDVLRALEPTPVRSPRALWYEGTGDVLGRELYVMERLGGTVYERELPDDLQQDTDRIRRMADSMIGQIAAIHAVDLDATGLRSLGDGDDHLTRDLDHWASEIERVQRGPLPALVRLLAELRARQPEQTAAVTLVHGDSKPGNFAFGTDDEVSAVFDWEMATLGDPLTDVGWAELLWTMPGSFTAVPGAPDADWFVRRYEELSGIVVRERAWYRAHQAFKMAAIMLVGSMLYDRGHSDDVRLGFMGFGVPMLTSRGLAELGIDDDLDHGPVQPTRALGQEPSG